jgi:alpha-L-fucosidase
MKKAGLILSIFSLSFIGCNQKVAQKKFEPTIASLQQYECPEWFRDAKFGIWAHWVGGYTLSGGGDWYARNMYIEGSKQYKMHLKNHGHPSEFGYKDLIDQWTDVSGWDANAQMKLFKKAGAKYFIALCNHHDNFDMWDSKYQEWNSVNYGPKVNFVKLWKEAADKEGLTFGLTSHLERSYSWFQTAKGADKEGPYKGVPYDGADSANYHIYHPPFPDNLALPQNPPKSWCDEWYKRAADVIEKYDPKLYYTDSGIPFPGQDNFQAGLRVAAKLYNNSIEAHGKNDAIMCFKNWLHVQPQGQWGQFYDGIGTRNYERDRSDEIRKEPWQTDTSLGAWIYTKGGKYRTTQQIIHELVDIVSKNGNLLLNIPHRPDGSFDDEALQFLKEMGSWMDINGESIYETRPWKIFGLEELRIVQKDGNLYVTSFEWPENGRIEIPFVLTNQPGVELNEVKLLGYEGELKVEETDKGLVIELPNEKPCNYAWAFKISGKNLIDIDLSEVDLRGAEGKAEDATKVWLSVSGQKEISSGYKAAEANEQNQVWAVKSNGDVALLVGDDEKVFAEKAVDISCSIKGDVVIVTPKGELKSKVGDKWKLIPSPKKVSRVAVSPEGHIAVVNQDKSLAKFDGEWKALRGGGKDIGYGPDGLIAHVGNNNGLYISEGNGWKGVGGSSEYVCISPKTGRCITVNQEGDVYVWKGAWVAMNKKAKDVGCGKSNDDEVITIIKNNK